MSHCTYSYGTAGVTAPPSERLQQALDGAEDDDCSWRSAARSEDGDGKTDWAGEDGETGRSEDGDGKADWTGEDGEKAQRTGPARMATARRRRTWHADRTIHDE